MANRRAQIILSPEEQLELLEAERVVVVATLGPRGWPHLMPLWFTLREPEADPLPDGPPRELWVWTYAKSQKVRNLERDARCTLQVEAGTEYAELRGLMLDCDAVIHREPGVVAPLGAELAGRYAGADRTPELEAAMRRQAAKRVGLQFRELRRVSWDHRKLGGTH